MSARLCRIRFVLFLLPYFFVTFQAASSESDAPEPKPVAARENCPLQLVSTGNAEDDYSFTLCENNLDRVLSKVKGGAISYNSSSMYE